MYDEYNELTVLHLRFDCFVSLPVQRNKTVKSHLLTQLSNAIINILNDIQCYILMLTLSGVIDGFVQAGSHQELAQVVVMRLIAVL